MSRIDRDLFDDTTMSFGDHLDELRTALIKSIYGIVIGAVFGLFWGAEIIDAIRHPLSEALRDYEYEELADSFAGGQTEDFGDWIYEQFGFDVLFGSDREKAQAAADGAEKNATLDAEEAIDAVPSADNLDSGGVTPDGAIDETPLVGDNMPLGPAVMTLQLDAYNLAQGLHQAYPDAYPAPTGPIAESDRRGQIEVKLYGQQAAQIQGSVDALTAPVGLTVQEAFMTYLKVSLIAGVILSSPWTFYQIWMFVAAGLYPHERAWVRRYGWLSLTLFLGGAMFCFYLVLPFALNFMLGFYELIGVRPNITLNSWISMATFIPLLFGVSFQLPLVMLFLQRIGLFSQTDYREKRRVAIFVIAVLSMVLTPQDPTTMIMMMIPLTILYEFGIKLCDWSPPANPFSDPIETTGREVATVN